jgi:hypothetical protein
VTRGEIESWENIPDLAPWRIRFDTEIREFDEGPDKISRFLIMDISNRNR